MHKNDVITLKLCKTIELIKCNVCMKYEPSTKCATQGIKENKFMTSSLQVSLETDSRNTDQLIKTAVANLSSWSFQDWLGIIKPSIYESVKLFRLPERILLTKTWKTVLVCRIHKNDVIRRTLWQKVDYKCV